MSADFDNAITVDVRLESPPVPVEQFGVIMVVDTPGAGFTERIRFYESADDVNGDTDLSAFQTAALLAGFSQTPKPSKLAAGRIDVGDANLTATMDAILAENDEWFAFTISSRLAADLALGAAWAEANDRLYIAQSSDSGVHASTYVPAAGSDVFNDLKDASYTMTVPVWHDTDAEALDFAWAAGKLAVNPDLETTSWRHYTVTGIGPISLTPTQCANIVSKCGNLYLTLAKQGAMGEGTTASGHPIDCIITREWLEARLFEKCAQAVLRASNRGRKIPYTNAGIQSVGGEILAVLEQGVRVGHFRRSEPTDNAPLGSPFVDIPDINDVPAGDIEGRVLNIEAGALQAGAIEEVGKIVFVAAVSLA